MCLRYARKKKKIRRAAPTSIVVLILVSSNDRVRNLQANMVLVSICLAYRELRIFKRIVVVRMIIKEKEARIQIESWTWEE